MFKKLSYSYIQKYRKQGPIEYSFNRMSLCSELAQRGLRHYRESESDATLSRKRIGRREGEQR